MRRPDDWLELRRRAGWVRRFGFRKKSDAMMRLAILWRREYFRAWWAA